MPCSSLSSSFVAQPSHMHAAEISVGFCCFQALMFFNFPVPFCSSDRYNKYSVQLHVEHFLRRFALHINVHPTVNHTATFAHRIHVRKCIFIRLDFADCDVEISGIRLWNVGSSNIVNSSIQQYENIYENVTCYNFNVAVEKSDWTLEIKSPLPELDRRTGVVALPTPLKNPQTTEHCLNGIVQKMISKRPRCALYFAENAGLRAPTFFHKVNKN